MNVPSHPPLESLRPGTEFLVLLACLVAAGLGGRALIVRRIGTHRFDAATQRFEGMLFIVVLGAMLGLSALQVLMRNLFHSGLLWIDPLVRTLVLWVAFLGAMVATSHGRHLHVDAVHRLLPERILGPVDRTVSIIAAVCCALLANGAYIYLREEYQHGVSPFLGVPSWFAQSILLWGFALMCYRFLVRSIWIRPKHAGI